MIIFNNKANPFELDYKFLFIVFFLSLVCCLFLSYEYIAISILILLFPLYLFGQEFLLALSIIIFLIITGPHFENARAYLSTISILTLAFFFFKRYGFDFKCYPKIPNNLLFFIIVLNIILFISASFSADPYVSLNALSRQIIFFVICYFYYSLIVSTKSINGYVNAIFISVFILGISILTDLFRTGFTLFLFEKIIIRYAGLYENPNYVGLLLLIVIPLNIVFFFRKYKHNNIIKILLMLLLLMHIMLLFISDSRSSIVGTILASLATIFLLRKKIFIRVIGVILILFLLSLVSKEIVDFVEMYFRVERAGNREIFWNAGLDIISDHPYIGIGPEQFDKYFFSYMPSLVNQFYDSKVWSIGRPHPHNFFLLWTSENGIIGFVCSVYIFALFFYYSIKTYMNEKNNRTQYVQFSAAAIGIGIGLLFRAFFEVTGILTYGFITRDLPFWIIFLIVLYLHQNGKSKNIN